MFFFLDIYDLKSVKKECYLVNYDLFGHLILGHSPTFKIVYEPEWCFASDYLYSRPLRHSTVRYPQLPQTRSMDWSVSYLMATTPKL